MTDLAIVGMHRFAHLGDDWYYAFGAVVVHAALNGPAGLFALVCTSNSGTRGATQIIYSLFTMSSSGPVAVGAQQVLSGVDFGRNWPIFTEFNRYLGFDSTYGGGQLYGSITYTNTPVIIDVHLASGSLVVDNVTTGTEFSSAQQQADVTQDRLFTDTNTFFNVEAANGPVDYGVRALEDDASGSVLFSSPYKRQPDVNDAGPNQNAILFGPRGVRLTDSLMSLAAEYRAGGLVGGDDQQRGLALGVVTRSSAIIVETPGDGPYQPPRAAKPGGSGGDLSFRRNF